MQLLERLVLMKMALTKYIFPLWLRSHSGTYNQFWCLHCMNTEQWPGDGKRHDLGISQLNGAQ